MHILHLALGGCLKAAPVRYGVTEDTGGHIAYVLGAAMAQAALPQVASVDIVTRAFDGMDPIHAQAVEEVAPGCRILRLSTANRAYLAKEALEAELPALAEAFCAMLAGMTRKPDVIHAHFADAARLARTAQKRFGIPWIYTPIRWPCKRTLPPPAVPICATGSRPSGRPSKAPPRSSCPRATRPSASCAPMARRPRGAAIACPPA